MVGSAEITRRAYAVIAHQIRVQNINTANHVWTDYKWGLESRGFRGR